MSRSIIRGKGSPYWYARLVIDGETILKKSTGCRSKRHANQVGGRLLLDQRAEIGTRYEGGWTALHVAAANDSAEVAGLLVERGADLRARNDGGLSPIRVAVLAGSANATRVLIAKGAESDELLSCCNETFLSETRRIACRVTVSFRSPARATRFKAREKGFRASRVESVARREKHRIRSANTLAFLLGLM